jgi:4-hydroxy-2-oxoglutarate aldolase
MDLCGVLAALPTPFDERDCIDVARLRAALPRWLRSPLRGFLVLGSTGEAPCLTDAECDQVVEETRALVPRGRALIAGTGRESTEATVRATRRAGALGADAVLVRTPSTFKAQMTSDAFLRHYTRVADDSPVPVLLYNFSAFTGVSLRADTVARLAEHPNIIGVKESGSDIAHISDLVTMTDAGFAVMAGSASTFHAALGAGVTGGILALAGLLADDCVELFECARAGNAEAARGIQRRLLPIARLISTEYGVPGLKAALALMGCDVGLPRPPLAPPGTAAVSRLQEALAIFKEVTT